MTIIDGETSRPSGPLRDAPIRAAIIEDLREVREGLATLINEKLQVHSKTEAVVKALRERLV
jgi:hypothetical protein